VPTKKPSGTPSAASSSSKPPERLTVFLDESLDSDSIAEALSAAGAVVERLTKHLPKGADDSTWLAFAGTKGWVVLTRDKRIRYRRLERLALQAARVRAFVFTGGNVTLSETARILAQALPAIEAICAREAGPFIYHIGQSGMPRRVD
jgi:predicted nuclease of predicted toxin-antitoxin system